jgi:hypothetical protein
MLAGAERKALPVREVIDRDTRDMATAGKFISLLLFHRPDAYHTTSLGHGVQTRHRVK